MLVFLNSFVERLTPRDTIEDRRLAVTGRETYNSSMSLQYTSNSIHLTVGWVNIPSLALLPTTSTYVC